MGNYQNAGTGIKKMFIAAVGAIICSVLLIIPLINILAAVGALVFLIISMVGLYEAGKDIEGCKNAFVFTVIRLVVRIVGVFFKTGILHALFTIADDVLGLLIVYSVCTSIEAVMQQIGASDVAQKGHTVWLINLVCYIVMIVVAVLNLIPLVNILGGVISIITSIVTLVAEILYMIFLNKSYSALGA